MKIKLNEREQYNLSDFASNVAYILKHTMRELNLEETHINNVCSQLEDAEDKFLIKWRDTPEMCRWREGKLPVEIEDLFKDMFGSFAKLKDKKC